MPDRRAKAEKEGDAVNKQKRAFSKGFIYLYLGAVGFCIIYPILVLIATSGKDLYGLVDPLVKWIPTNFEWDNFVKAFELVGGIEILLQSFGYVLLVATIQTLVSAVTGYGFARATFPGHNLLFLVMLLAFFIPDQVMFLPRYVMFADYGILGTLWTVILPTLFGQGVQSTLMILIFWLFFRQQPASLEEAARLDGASDLRVFTSINLPLAKPGFIITFVLSFAFNWNDTYFAEVYFKDKIETSNLLLQQIREIYSSMYGSDSTATLDEYFNSGIEAAGALIIIVPLVILYLVLQKKLMESVDMAGITGE